MMIFTGCEKEDSTYQKAAQQGKLAMANGEYDKAMAAFELALDEKSDEDIQRLYNQLASLKRIQKAYSEEDWKEVQNAGESLLDDEELSTLIKDEVNRYINEAQKHQKHQEILAECNTKLEEIKQLIKSQEYEEAMKRLKEIEQNEAVINDSEMMASIKSLVEQIVKQEADEKERLQKEEILKLIDAMQRNDKGRTDKQSLKEVKYKNYNNARYGFSIEYPDIFDEQQLPTNGDGCIFVDHSRNVYLTVSAHNNNDDVNAETEYYTALTTHNNINYEFQKDNWYVLSWEEGEVMYYEKVVVGEGSTNLFTISYPSVDEKLYDDIVERLFHSFKTPGISECW